MFHRVKEKPLLFLLSFVIQLAQRNFRSEVASNWHSRITHQANFEQDKQRDHNQRDDPWENFLSKSLENSKFVEQPEESFKKWSTCPTLDDTDSEKTKKNES